MKDEHQQPDLSKKSAGPNKVFIPKAKPTNLDGVVHKVPNLGIDKGILHIDILESSRVEHSNKNVIVEEPDSDFQLTPPIFKDLNPSTNHDYNLDSMVHSYESLSSKDLVFVYATNEVEESSSNTEGDNMIKRNHNFLANSWATLVDHSETGGSEDLQEDFQEDMNSSF